MALRDFLMYPLGKRHPTNKSKATLLSASTLILQREATPELSYVFNYLISHKMQFLIFWNALCNTSNRLYLNLMIKYNEIN